MFTRCQACHTVHPLNAALLAQGGGKYRCGKCHKMGDALQALFDEWPEASEQARRPGETPVLGSNLKLDQAEGEQTTEGDSEEADFLIAGVSRSARGRLIQRGLWVSGALVLVIVVTMSLMRFFSPGLIEQPLTETALSKLGLKSEVTQAPLRAIDEIELVSRELTTHPTDDDKLLLNLTLVNRAKESQAYPDIDVILLDLQNNRLARHVFQPVDYLTRSHQFRNGMTPEAFLTINLELPDPGERAVGFELQFH